MMGVGEAIVAVLIACAVLKPNDIPAIAREFRKLRSLWTELKKKFYDGFCAEGDDEEDGGELDYYDGLPISDETRPMKGKE